jgi:small GTP-binding protein
MSASHVVRPSENEHFRKRLPKIVVVGEACVGKTSLIQQMTRHEFKDALPATIGMEYSHVTASDSGNQAHVWDLAGHMRASALNPQHLRGAQGVVIVGDLNNPTSITDGFKCWLREVRSVWSSVSGTSPPPDTEEGRRQEMPVRAFMVFNKTDVRNLTEDEKQTYSALVGAYGCHGCFFTSATNIDEVRHLFNTVINDVYKSAAPPPPVAPEVRLKREKSRCCEGSKRSPGDETSASLAASKATPIHRARLPKIVVVGDGGVGKTSLIQQMSKGTFRFDYQPTIGMEYSQVTASDSGNQAHVWDLADHMRAPVLNRQHLLRGVEGIIIVGDLSNPASITYGFKRWLREVRVACSMWSLNGTTSPPDTEEGRRQEMPVRAFMVFNKTEFLEENEKHTYSALVGAYGCHGCFFTSARDIDEVRHLFNTVINDVYENGSSQPSSTR